MVSLIMEGIIHMLGEASVESGVVASDQNYDLVIKMFEFAVEMQKQKREDLRDLLELRVSRMDMYQLVCALLLGFGMMLFVENPMLDSNLRTHWILLPFLVSNISAIGCMFISLTLSLHTSTATHSDGVRKLLQYMRVSLPSPAELRNIQKNCTLLARMKGNPNPASTVLQMVQEPNTAQPLAGPGTPPAPPPWDSADHVREFLAGQEKEALFDAYTRLTLILGINQFLQALSYYLLGVVTKQSPTGGLICAVGTQALGLLLLRLDVESVDLADFLWVVTAHFLPPLIAGIVLVMQFHGAAHIWTMVAIASFLLHMLWICYVLREIAPTIEGGHKRAPDRFKAVCQILRPNDASVGDGPKPLPWLVTRRFLLLIASMWMIGMLMNLGEVFWNFEVPIQIESHDGNPSQIQPNIVMI